MDNLNRRTAIGLGLVSAGAASLTLTAMARADDGDDPKHNVQPEEGYVPTSEVAIAIAVAVWGPIYGTCEIADEEPYRATLDDDVWTVEGSLPEGMKGGVAIAEIAKADGRILRVSHGK